MKIAGGQSRAPHQVQHGLRKMLIGLADNAAFFRSGISFAEYSIEISQGDAPAGAVCNRGNPSSHTRDQKNEHARKQRDQFRGNK